MSTLSKIIVLCLGLIISLFLFWRKLREDYQDTEIFSLSFMTLFGAGIGFLITNIVFPNLNFWSAALFGFLFLAGRARRFGMRFFEILEAATPSFFVFLLFAFVSSLVAIDKFEWVMLTAFILVLLVLILFYTFVKNYRRFLWYPSGKIGFASLVCLFLFFLVRGVLAMFFPSMIIFSSIPLVDIIGGIGVALCALTALYIRSGRTDFKFR